MVKNKKRHLRKTIKYALIGLSGLLLVGIIVFILNFNFKFVGKKSIHDDALTYKTKSCLAFYPNSEKGKDIAKNICDKALKDTIYDYALVPYGDYYLVSYHDGTKYYVDKEYKELVIDNINEDGKKIIADYLRYQLKKEEKDFAYTLEFLEESFYQNLDLSEVTYKVDGPDLLCHFPKYEADIRVPLKYMQSACNINLGYENELYHKPHYLSRNRKMICFTFDDGPDMSLKTSGQIVDTLYRYDSSATFYILGSRLGEKQINFCKESVEKGMEYGSHTQSHKNLTKLSVSDVTNEIMTPYHDLYDNEFGFGYQMKTFRPPYGAYSDTVRQATNLTAVLWNVDSKDWSYRTKYDAYDAVDVIYNEVVKDADENDVVLFHDIYQTSVDAASKLITYYINQGYQIVNVSELMEVLGVTGASYFSGK